MVLFMQLDSQSSILACEVGDKLPCLLLVETMPSTSGSPSCDGCSAEHLHMRARA